MGFIGSVVSLSLYTEQIVVLKKYVSEIVGYCHTISKSSSLLMHYRI